jgi:cytochrome P450
VGAVPELMVHRSLPRALQLIGSDRLRWLDEAAALGPVAALRMGPLKTWVITDPDAARKMLVTDNASWVRPPTLLVPMRVAVGENLFTQRDRAWSQLQPAVAPAFRKSALERRLADLDALIDDEVQAVPLNVTIDLDLATARIALVVAGWVLFGEQLDRTRAEELADHQREVVRWVGPQVGKLSAIVPRAFGASGRAMKRHRAFLNAYADDVIARANTETHDDDVLGALFRARPSRKALTPHQLRGQVLGLLLAGNDTTAAGLSWALVHGAHHPAEWQRVRNDPGRHTLPFIHETLRLTPPVWGFSRTPAKSGVTLNAANLTTRVRRGQVATIYLRAIHHAPTSWDNPLQFNPSRHDPTLITDQHRQLLAFGLGPRGCIGQHLAMAELTAVLPAFARHGRITIDEPVTEDATFSLRVHGGLTGQFIRSAQP